MNKEPLTLEGEAHFIGSFPRDGQMYDYYELSVDGFTKYVFVKTGRGEENIEPE